MNFLFVCSGVLFYFVQESSLSFPNETCLSVLEDFFTSPPRRPSPVFYQPLNLLTTRCCICSSLQMCNLQRMVVSLALTHHSIPQIGLELLSQVPASIKTNGSKPQGVGAASLSCIDSFSQDMHRH